MATDIAKLVEEASANDLAAFGSLVTEFRDMVYGTVLALIANAADAQDVAQEVFIQAWRDLGGLRSPERFPAWLYSIARHRSLDFLRRRPPAARPLDPEEAGALGSVHPAPDRVAEMDEITQMVHAAIGSLSEPNRLAITLYYISGYGTRQVADYLGVPQGTVKRRLHDSRKLLKERVLAMVEGTLKQTRPQDEFTERVVRRIRQVRVLPGSRTFHMLLLTDTDGRSFGLSSVAEVCRSVASSGEEGRPDPADLHALLIRCIRQLGGCLEDVTVKEMKGVARFAELRLRFGEDIVRADCAADRAVAFAAHAGVPVLVDRDFFERLMWKREDGQPLSPADAWRRVRKQEANARHRKDTVFQDLAAVVAAIETDPGCHKSRRALSELAPGFGFSPPKVRDTSGGLPALEAWVEQTRGTELEGIAAGLVGAVFLYNVGEFDEDVSPEQRECWNHSALEYLERGHELCPEAMDIAFDLATAYATMGKIDEALALIRTPGFDHKASREYGNFQALWPDPRFQAVAGMPDPRCESMVREAQFDVIDLTGQSLVAERAIPVKLAPLTIGGISKPLLREIKARSGLQGLLAAQQALPPESEANGRMRVAIKLQGDSDIAVPIRQADRESIYVPFRTSSAPQPEPQAPRAFCDVLQAAGAEISAVALLRRGRTGLQALLVVGRGDRHEFLDVPGPQALVLALTAQCPLLVSKELAQRLRIAD